MADGAKSGSCMGLIFFVICFAVWRSAQSPEPDFSKYLSLEDYQTKKPSIFDPDTSGLRNALIHGALREGMLAADIQRIFGPPTNWDTVFLPPRRDNELWVYEDSRRIYLTFRQGKLVHWER